MGYQSAPGKRPLDDTDAINERPAKRQRFDYDDVFKVLVGPKQKSFAVHKDHICAKSRFFKAVCSNRWREGQEKLVRLPEADKETFQAYLDWVYSDHIACDEASSRPLIKLHLLGDVLDDVKLRNQTMKLLIDRVCDNLPSPNTSSIRLIWENTTPNSLLRKWIINVVVQRMCKGTFKRTVAALPAELVQQVAVQLMNQTVHGSMAAFRESLPEYLEAEDDAGN